MNKKAIAGILARLDDPDQIETLLELIANKADEPLAVTEPTGQLFSISDTKPTRRTVDAPMGKRHWDAGSQRILLQMRADGYSTQEIAYRLGRSVKAIRDRLYRIRIGEIAS